MKFENVRFYEVATDYRKNKKSLSALDSKELVKLYDMYLSINYDEIDNADNEAECFYIINEFFNDVMLAMAARLKALVKNDAIIGEW